jgi:hypothetical protein
VTGLNIGDCGDVHPEVAEWLQTVLSNAAPVLEISRDEVTRICAVQDAGNRVVQAARGWAAARRDRTTSGMDFHRACQALGEAVGALEALSASEAAPGSESTTEPGTAPTDSHSGPAGANQADTEPTEGVR